MAQYLYKFSESKPSINNPPFGFIRVPGLSFDASLYLQELSQTPRGLEVLQKTPEASGTTPNFYQGYMFGPQGLSAVDAEVLVCITQAKYTGGNFSNDGPGFYFRASGGNNYCHLAMSGFPAGNPGGFFRQTKAGVNAGEASTPGVFSSRSGVKTWIRAKCAGNAFTLKSWLDGAAESSAQQYSVVNSAADPVVSAGGLFFGLLGASGKDYSPSSGTEYVLHQMSVGTDGDVAPSTLPIKSVSGVVTGPDGLPAQRVVRLYARGTGVLLGEAQSNSGSGAYSIQTTYAGEVNCVFSDDAAGDVFNDLILRTTPV